MGKVDWASWRVLACSTVIGPLGGTKEGSIEVISQDCQITHSRLVALAPPTSKIAKRGFMLAVDWASRYKWQLIKLSDKLVDAQMFTGPEAQSKKCCSSWPTMWPICRGAYTHTQTHRHTHTHTHTHTQYEHISFKFDKLSNPSFRWRKFLVSTICNYGSEGFNTSVFHWLLLSHGKRHLDGFVFIFCWGQYIFRRLWKWYIKASSVC